MLNMTLALRVLQNFIYGLSNIQFTENHWIITLIPSFVLILIPILCFLLIFNLRLKTLVNQKTEQLNKINQRLKRQIAELDHLYHHTPVGLCFVDTNLYYVHIDQALADMNGATINEHLQCPVKDILPDIYDQVE